MFAWFACDLREAGREMPTTERETRRKIDETECVCVLQNLKKLCRERVNAERFLSLPLSLAYFFGFVGASEIG